MTNGVSVRFVDGGYCRQNEGFVGGPCGNVRDFHAMFVHGIHPEHGEFLIDTGYSPAFFDATRQFPERLLRRLTPVPVEQDFWREDYWRAQGIDVNNIRYVFISHFHPDHIAGLGCFPKATFIYRQECLAMLRQMSRMRQVFHGFLEGLIPPDFDRRSFGIAEEKFVCHPGNVVSTYDVWGDQSIVLLDLPGHAIGHTGMLIQDVRGPILYAVDAFWDADDDGVPYSLPWITRSLIHSFSQYRETVQKIMTLSHELSIKTVVCHGRVTTRFRREFTDNSLFKIAP
jgi:glyoxylase-like metal-dependent hydrolase (beta-lactamase superfamily II)